MQRRGFIGLVGSLLAWPLAARAQQPRIASIGVLISSNPEPTTTMLKDALREIGYVEGQNVHFEFRSGDGSQAVLRALAEELVRLRVDVIVAFATPAALAAKQTTTAIPIVMARVGDPIRSELVSNLARPEGNITGFSSMTSELATKMLELVREILPSTKRVGVLANVADPFSLLFVEEIEASGQAMAVAIKSISVRSSNEVEAAIATFDKQRVDAVVVQPSIAYEPTIDLMKKYHLPSLSTTSLYSQAGGLMSYAADTNESYHRIAFFIDKILKGAKPSELPVEQPTKYELAINLKTAKILGLTVPSTLLVRADEVIE